MIVYFNRLTRCTVLTPLRTAGFACLEENIFSLKGKYIQP